MKLITTHSPSLFKIEKKNLQAPWSKLTRTTNGQGLLEPLPLVNSIILKKIKSKSFTFTECSFSRK